MTPAKRREKANSQAGGESEKDQIAITALHAAEETFGMQRRFDVIEAKKMKNENFIADNTTNEKKIFIVDIATNEKKVNNIIISDKVIKNINIIVNNKAIKKKKKKNILYLTKILSKI